MFKETLGARQALAYWLAPRKIKCRLNVINRLCVFFCAAESRGGCGCAAGAQGFAGDNVGDGTQENAAACTSTRFPSRMCQFLEQLPWTAAGHSLACVRKEKEQRKDKGPPAARAFFPRECALSCSHFLRVRLPPPSQQHLAPFFHVSALPTRRLARRRSVYARPALSWAARP